MELLQLDGLPLPHDGHRQDEDVQDLHGETHGHECCTAAVLVAPASRGPVPGRASHGRTEAASQSSSRCRACSAEAAIVRLTHVRERVPARLPGGLAGWGTPPWSGPRGLRSRSREVGYIQIEAHGAQHPGVLYFSLRLKLLAPELLAHPSSRQLSLCYPASLKLHCGRASCISGRRCIEQEPACSSSRGEELTVLAGSMRRTTGSYRDRDEELVGRAGKPVA